MYVERKGRSKACQAWKRRRQTEKDKAERKKKMNNRCQTQRETVRGRERLGAGEETSGNASLGERSESGATERQG